MSFTPPVRARLRESYAALALLADRRLALLAAANVLDRMSVALFVPLLPLYANRLGASPLLVGALFAAETGARALCSTPLGRLADRVGRRAPIAAGTTLSGLAVASVGVVEAPLALVAVRALDGVGGALRGPATTAYVGDAVPDSHRGRAMGAYQTLGRLGVVLGPALGGLLAARDLGLPFVALGVPTALAGVALAVVLPRVAGDIADADESAPGLAARLLRSRPVLALGVASLLAGVSGGAFGPLFALHLDRALGVGPGYVGLTWSVFGAALVCCTPVGGALADSTGRVRVVVAGQLGWMAAYAGLALAATPLVPPVALALGGVASAVAGPAKSALNYETAPDGDRATAVGLYGSLWAAGSTVGPLLGGAVAGRVGAAGALLALAALAAAQAAFVALAVRER